MDQQPLNLGRVAEIAIAGDGRISTSRAVKLAFDGGVGAEQRTSRLGGPALALGLLAAACAPPPTFEERSQIAKKAAVEFISRGPYCKRPVTLRSIEDLNPGCCYFRRNPDRTLQTFICFQCSEAPDEIQDISLTFLSETSREIYHISTSGSKALRPANTCPPQFGYGSEKAN